MRPDRFDRFDRTEFMSLEQLRSLERAEARWPEFDAQCHREGVAAAEARSPRGLLAALVDPMDRDPLADDDSPRDRYWTSAADRMNGVG